MDGTMLDSSAVVKRVWHAWAARLWAREQQIEFGHRVLLCTQRAFDGFGLFLRIGLNGAW
jgi:beta-phosphoglucomutase-like phosphatase (HAD superfamily)